MDYQKMWYTLKAELLSAADKQEYSFQNDQLKATVLNVMDAIECAAAGAPTPLHSKEEA